MKNAVAFFGLTRSLDVTSQNLKDNIVKDYDLFVHTWKLNSKSENWHKSKEPSVFKTLNNYTKARIFHSNLISLQIEKQNIHEPEFCFWKNHKIYYSNQLNMWTSFARVAKMVLEQQKNLEEYDVVLFTRSDIYFNRPLPQVFMNKAKSRVVFAGNKSNGTYSAEDLIIGIPGQHIQKLTILPDLYSKHISLLVENKLDEKKSIENFLISALIDLEIPFEYYPFEYGLDFQIIRDGSKLSVFLKLLKSLKFWK